MKVFFLSLLGLWPALSSTISVSSTGFTITAVATLTSPGMVSDAQSYSQSYTLLITGGSGQGMAYPGFVLSGGTNESNGAWNILGSWVEFGVSGIYDIWAGDPYGPGPPAYACGTHTFPSCGIPFTFGVAETIQVHASVSAMIQSGPNFTSQQTASGSVTFDANSFRLTDVMGQTLSGNAIVAMSDAVPEPATWTMLALVSSGLSFPLFRKLRRRRRSEADRRYGERRAN